MITWRLCPQCLRSGTVPIRRTGLGAFGHQSSSTFTIPYYTKALLGRKTRALVGLGSAYILFQIPTQTLGHGMHGEGGLPRTLKLI